METPIKDIHQRTIGFFEEGRVSNHGVLFIKSVSRKKLGWYDRHDNTTRNACGKILFIGNMIQTLIKE